MNKTKWHSKVSYMLVSLALLLSLTIMAIPMAGPVEAAEEAYYNATEIQDWLISQISSTNITFTNSTVSLDDTNNTMTVNASVTARGTTVYLDNIEFAFDGTRNMSISGELSALGKRPRFSGNVTVKCELPGKIPQVESISNITIAGFTPSLSPGDLNEITNTINKAINASGFKLDSLLGNLTGIEVGGGPTLTLIWSGGFKNFYKADIESQLNNAATWLVNKANDYLSTGDNWSLNVTIGGGKVTFNATATALNKTAKIESMNVTFADTTASIDNATVSVWNKSATFSGTAKIACTSYTPSITAVPSLSVGDENPGLRNWTQDPVINSALRDALKRLANNIIADTGLECRISKFNRMAVTDSQLKVWWYAKPVTPGGGGGGGAVRYYLDTNVSGIEGSYRISDTGELLETIKVTTKDGMLTMSVPKGTICLGKSDARLEVLTIAVDESPPSPPDNGHIIGAAYDCNPDGANFAPPVNMTFRYDEGDLPAGAVEGDLDVYFWNVTAWEEVPSTADPVGNRVTATVSSFGDCSFAVMWLAPAAPSNFTLADLSISPARVSPGENVTISVLVTNVGVAEGTYQAVLKIDDVVTATRSVTLGPAESTTVTFTIAEEQPGTYQVKIGTLEGSFVVEEVAPASWISRYWWVILEILVVIGLLLFFFRWWRPRKVVGS